MEKKRLPDTPWHVGYTKKEENDPRRHKARCVFLQEGICHCGHDASYMRKCIGSSHCMSYSELSEEEANERREQLLLEFSVRDHFARPKNVYQIEKVTYKRQKYYKIHLSERESIMVPYEPKMTKEKIRAYIRAYYDSK